MTEKAYADLNLDTLCVMIVLLVQTLMGVTFLHYVVSYSRSYSRLPNLTPAGLQGGWLTPCSHPVLSPRALTPRSHPALSPRAPSESSHRREARRARLV